MGNRPCMNEYILNILCRYCVHANLNILSFQSRGVKFVEQTEDLTEAKNRIPSFWWFVVIRFECRVRKVA